MGIYTNDSNATDIGSVFLNVSLITEVRESESLHGGSGRINALLT